MQLALMTKLYTGSLTMCVLTGSPAVTTPISFTTVGCLNCPLIAASCKNLIFSSSDAPV